MRNKGIVIKNVNNRTKKLEISNNLGKKVDMICKFTCVKPTYQNDNIKSTNIAYAMLHIITINKNDYLILCDYIFVSFLPFLTKIHFFVKIRDN